jgi:hypothetical protein
MAPQLKQLKITTLFGLALVLASCGGADIALKKSQEFGGKASKFEANTKMLSEDLYDSCVRRITYITIRNGNSNRDLALSSCQQLNRPAVEEINMANGVVTDYAVSVGKLAADDVVQFDDQFNEVQKALTSFSIPLPNGAPVTLPSAAINTGTQIANFVFRWAADRYRKGTLRTAIICADTPFHTYTSGLQEAFNLGYINGLLKDEEDTARSYFDFYASRLRVSGSERDFMELEREYSTTLQTLNSRRNAAHYYLGIISEMKQAHTKLKELFLGNVKPPSEALCKTYLGTQSQATSTSLHEPETQSTASQISQPLSLYEQQGLHRIYLEHQGKINHLLTKMDHELNAAKRK